MARKGRGKRRKEQQQRQQYEQQQSAGWRALWDDVQSNGNGAEGLPRPTNKCGECNTVFDEKDSFHYTRLGPIHGWGGFETTGTCWIKQRQRAQAPPKKQAGKCLECGQVILKSEKAHAVNGGRVHGAGKYNKRGTCLTALRGSIRSDLTKLATGFVAGTVSEAEIEAAIKETRDREAAIEELLHDPKKHTLFGF